MCHEDSKGDIEKQDPYFALLAYQTTLVLGDNQIGVLPSY